MWAQARPFPSRARPTAGRGGSVDPGSGLICLTVSQFWSSVSNAFSACCCWASRHTMQFTEIAFLLSGLTNRCDLSISLIVLVSFIWGFASFECFSFEKVLDPCKLLSEGCSVYFVLPFCWRHVRRTEQVWIVSHDSQHTLTASRCCAMCPK